MTAVDGADAGTKLRDLGWHQGALVQLPSEGPVSELIPQGSTHALVASQDCDIVALTAVEPNVDIVPALLSAEPEQAVRYGKHPRRVCLALSEQQFATVDVRERITVPKAAVSDLAPLEACRLSIKERRLFARWLGKRYSRHAFPDVFNDRLRSQKAKLEELAKKRESAEVTAIFVMLDQDRDLDSAIPYKVVLWFACRRDLAESPAKRVAIEKYAARFADVLDACDGIQVDEHELRAHFDITMEDLESFKRFDYDFRSEAPKPGGGTGPTEAD